MARLSSIALIVAMNVVICVLSKEFYSDQYDNLDVTKALNDKELRKEYYNCFMETAPCKTPEQKFFIGIFSEAFQTKCNKCTEKQKMIFETVADWFTKNKPDEWQKIVAKTLEDFKKKAAQT